MQQQQQLPSVQSNTDPLCPLGPLVDEIKVRHGALLDLVEDEKQCDRDAVKHWIKLKRRLEDTSQCWQQVLASNHSLPHPHVSLAANEMVRLLKEQANKAFQMTQLRKDLVLGLDEIARCLTEYINIVEKLLLELLAIPVETRSVEYENRAEVLKLQILRINSAKKDFSIAAQATINGMIPALALHEELRDTLDNTCKYLTRLNNSYPVIRQTRLDLTAAHVLDCVKGNIYDTRACAESWSELANKYNIRIHDVNESFRRIYSIG